MSQNDLALSKFVNSTIEYESQQQKLIGTINTQAPGKVAIPMWVYKNVKNINQINKQNMVNYYPEINSEINKSLIPPVIVKKSWADYSDDED